MTDTLRPHAAPDPEPARRPSRAIPIAIAVVGGIVGLGTIAQGAVATWPSAPSERVVVELAASELSAATVLEVDSGEADVTVAFADVDAATLTVDAPDADRWRLEMRDDTIEVRDGSGWGPFDWDWGLGRGDRGRAATLVLPASLAGALDGELTIDSGSLDVAGEWRRLDVDLDSGRAIVAGTATAASLDVASGSAEVDLVVDGDVRLDLASGEMVVLLEHTGDLEIDVASGSVEARLEGGPYEVTTDAAVGEALVDVPQAADADQSIAIEVAAGSVRLSGR